MNCVNHPDQDAPFQCYRCQNPICVECETKLHGRSICPQCRRRIRERLAAVYEAETRRISYPGGLAGGFLAAAAAAFAWSQLAVLTGHRLCVGAILLGALVGYGVMMGAGQKRSPPLQQIAFVLTFFGVILSYFLIFLRTPGSPHLSLSGQRSAVLGALYAFPVHLSSLGLLDWLFLILGIACSYYIPRVRTVPDEPR